MVVESKDLSETNLLVKLCINIGIAVLFTQSIFVLSSINVTLSIGVIKEHKNNNNKEGHTTTTWQQLVQATSEISKALNQTKTSTATAVPSVSSLNPSNITNEKITSTEIAAENKVVIGDEESEQPFNPSPINIRTGDTITWNNNDVEIHTVTSGSPDNSIEKGKEFDSGNLNSSSVSRNQ